MKNSGMLYEKYIREQDYWPLQIIQDEYARALDLPLRIYNLSRAREIWQKFSQDADFKQRFPQQTDFHNYVARIATDTFHNFSQLDKDKEFWKNFFRKTQQDYRGCKKQCWLTTLGAGYSLIQSFSEYRRWRLRDFFYYYHLFIVTRQSGDFERLNTEPYFTGIEQADNLYVAFTSLSLSLKSEKEYLLVVGPVWKPTTILTGSTFEKERVSGLIKAFCQVISAPKTRKDNFIRMANNTFPVSEGRLHKHISQIKTGIASLLCTQLPKSLKLHRCDHVKLAEWSLFTPRICNLLSPNMLDKLLENTVYYRMDHPDKEVQAKPPWVKTDWRKQASSNMPTEKSGCEYQFELKNEEFSTANEEYLPLYFSNNFDETEKREFHNQLMIFLNRLSTRRNARRMELLLVLREWLNDHFSLLTEVHGKQAVLTEDELKERYDWLCHWIMDRTAANRVILYYYNHGDDTVKVIGIHCSKKHMIGEGEKQGITEQMKQIARNREQRKQFSCYDCIDQLAVQFHRGEEHNRYLTPSVLKNKTLSSITAPIMIHGRVWGALEVDGFYPFQFCWDNKKFIQDVANVLSLFFYLNHLLYRLHKLNFTENHNSIDDKYQHICHQLAVIFLSQGITLWIPSSGQTKKYECVRWYMGKNATGISAKQWDCPENDELISRVAQTKELFYQNEMGVGHFSDAWKTAQPNAYFEQFKITHICVVPLYVSEQKDELIGCIILYNTSNETFDSWERRVKFISEYVALSLKAIHPQKRKEEQNKNYIAHEMKQNVTLILEQARHFQKNKRFYFGSYEDIRKRLDSFIAQLEAEAVNIDKVEVVRALTDFKNSLNAPDFVEVERKFGLITHDLNLHSCELLKQIGWFSDHAASISIEEDRAVLLIKKEYEQPIDSPIDFHTEFSSIANFHRDTVRKKGIYFDYDEELMLASGIRLKMHSYNFRQLVKNLIDNAVKYASPHTAITGILTETARTVKFSLENSAPCLKEGEEERIFDEGFRGHYAQESNMHGQGKGLFIVRYICQLYNIDLQYRSEPKGNEVSMCLHKFILSFPKKMTEKMPYGKF